MSEQEIIELYEEDLTIAQIADELSVSRWLVQNRLSRRGLSRGKGPKYRSKCTIPEEEWKVVYLAGIIDGEGSITFSNDKKAMHGLQPWIGVGNSSKELIEWIDDHYKGNVSTETFKNKNWSRKWEWKVHRVLDIIKIIEAVQPYLIVKKLQAQKVLSFCYKRLEERGYTRPKEALEAAEEEDE